MGTGGPFSCEELTSREGYIAFRFAGRGANRAFAEEAGGHRWQGLSKGKTHSSTVTVAVLPEPKPSEFRLSSSDLKVETYRDSGPGGQNKNKNDTAVRITHIPTGVQACSTLKSQAQNKELALCALRARLAERERNSQFAARNKSRKDQIGSGMRADKIRTVAEQRSRVENHLNGKRMNIRRYMKGFIEEIL